jgi:hypothetical protein
MLISPEYCALNRELHERTIYGISGHKYAPMVDDLATKHEAQTILDYGSGRGTLKAALTTRNRPYRVLEYDPAIPGKEEKPIRADIVVCGDVLEHIEPECLFDVLDDIRNIARAAVFLVVSTVPAIKFLADGRNAHLIVEPSSWWLPKIQDRWRLRMFQDLGAEFVCIGTR